MQWRGQCRCGRRPRARTTAALLPALALAGGCSADGSTGADAELVARLHARIQHLEDIASVEKLQSKYAHLLFTQDYGRIFEECFAQERSDVSLEF